MWLYQGREITREEVDSHIGFVYIIENLTNNKKYLGKKLFQNTRTKTLKGKRKKVKTESDWLDYFGSNENLKEDVKLLGPENFRREVLRLCKSKGACNYFEAKYQMENQVLESDSWYNDHIWVRVHRTHLRLDVLKA